jgi:hypothetical protein
MIIYRCADRLSSDCGETPSGSGAERQHATFGAAIEAMLGQNRLDGHDAYPAQPCDGHKTGFSVGLPCPYPYMVAPPLDRLHLNQKLLSVEAGSFSSQKIKNKKEDDAE